MTDRCKRIKNIFNIVFATAFLACVGIYFTAFFVDTGADESFFNIRTLDAGWEQIKADGVHTQFTPGDKLPSASREPVIMQNYFPDDVKTGESFIIRSSNQEVFVFVEGEMRLSYKSDEGTGKRPTNRYIYVPLSDNDAGQKITIITIADGLYSGYTSTYYIAPEREFFQYIFQENAISFYGLMFLLVFSVIAMGVSAITKFVLHSNLRCTSLCLTALLMAISMISCSRVREFFYSNITVLDRMRQFAGYLLWIPFMSYLDTLTQSRHSKLLFTNKLLLMGFFMANLIDLVIPYASLSIIMLMIGSATVMQLIFIVILLSLESKSGHIREYKPIAVLTAIIVPAEMLEFYDIGIKPLPFGCMFFVLALSALIFTDIVSQESASIRTIREKTEAETANASKSAFLANMSHEIRTPVNSIIGMNEMILRESNDMNLLEYAQNIKSSSEYLLGILNDILDFSKIEAGKMETVEDRYSVPRMLVDIMRILNERAEKKNLAVSFNASPDIPKELNGDVTRVKQIILNLISNAVKYTDKGSVTFNADCEVDESTCRLIISVKDTGIGMTEEGLSKLFDKFTRLDLKKNIKIEGTGLGMAITKSLLTMMGGTIDVTSTYGKGSTFTVVIPQIILDPTPMGNFVSAASTDKNMSKAQEALFTAPDAHVLVVDDNKLNRVVFSKLLKRTMITVDDADGGLSCMDKCKDNKYDVIFMDHMMPEPDGIQTLKMLREADTLNKDVPVIVLTANAISGMKPEYLKQGFSDYMSKPIKADLLDEMLMNYLPKELIHLTGQNKDA